MFNNTEIAFQIKSDKELKKAYRIFNFIKNKWLIDFGSRLLKIAIFIRFPIKLFIKPVFEHFCGGESLHKCLNISKLLYSYKVKSILDYSIENSHKEKHLIHAYNEMLNSVEFAADKNEIPFIVFKLTALIPAKLLENSSLFSSIGININETIKTYIDRIDNICLSAKQKQLMVLIDAEDYKYQSAIDLVAENMMKKHNREKVVIFNTLQMYRKDRLKYLRNLLETSKSEKYFPGIKLVRGAYMEKERLLALQNNYLSPVFDSKKETDQAFDEALNTIIENIDHCSVFCGTHNENSTLHLVGLMRKNHLKTDDPRVYFSQLFGMSDHISFNLAHNNFNVAKYIPYGPAKNVLPYLIRRAQENSSVSGQSNRELSLILKELNRRKIKQNGNT